MDIRPIKTEDDYRATLREIETLMRAEDIEAACRELTGDAAL